MLKEGINVVVRTLLTTRGMLYSVGHIQDVHGNRRREHGPRHPPHTLALDCKNRAIEGAIFVCRLDVVQSCKMTDKRT
jgi:hypothetical protein